MTMLMMALSALAASPEVVEATDSMILAANAAYGSEAIHPSAGAARLRPVYFQNQMEILAQDLVSNGCTTDPLQSYQGGALNLLTTAATGAWDGGALSNGEVANGQFSGTKVGAEDVGALYSDVAPNGRYIADLEADGYFTGRWSRVAGRRGVFVGLNGHCDGTHPSEALADWIGEPMPDWTFDADRTVLGTGTAALLGGDLTDPENNGNEALGPLDPSWNWVSIFAFDEPFFQGAEGAFNIFDNQVGSGNAKWCCRNPSEASPNRVEVEFAEPIDLTHFTLTSGNDTPNRDPLWFHIEGSNDGVRWNPVYVRNDPASIWGTTRNQVVRFDIDQPARYFSFYRYIVFHTSGNSHQINELELFGNPEPI